ncbi:MAG TPA: LpqB family beta-propeller domain-containing protein [Thermoleophilaceae bacterium]
MSGGRLKRSLWGVFLAGLCALVVGAASASADDVTPVRTVDLSGSPAVTVADGPGDQNDSHVSGDLVTYTDHSGPIDRVRYHNLATGTDDVVPDPDGLRDILSSVNGTTITYRHGNSPNIATMYVFDSTDPSAQPHQVDPGQTSGTLEGAIGGQLVAWSGFFPPTGFHISVYDRSTGTTEQLTNDSLEDFNPAPSPNEPSLAWVRCISIGGNCDIWSATRSGGSWTQRQLTSGSRAANGQPGNDGTIVAYAAGGGLSDDLYWQPLEGGAESHLITSAAGLAVNAQVAASNGVIAFEQLQDGQQFDEYAYDTNTGFLYRLTNTPEDDSLSSISVAGRTATVTFTQGDAAGGDDVYAKTFELHEPPHLTADHAQVTGDEGSQASNTGTVSDPNGDGVSLTASIGHVTNNGDGTWSWSYTPDDGPAGPQAVTITGTDPDGLSDSVSFDLNVDNVAPSATFNAPGSATPGSAFTISLTGPSDPSSADTSAGFTYAFDCGDGTFPPSSSQSSASCTAPTSPGAVAVRGRIQDKDGGVSTYSATVQVSSPSSPIVFTSTRDGLSDIYTMHADGSGVTRLTHSALAIDANPAWSPDHSKIAFVSTRDGNSEIYTMNADGSSVKRLTNTHAIDITPTWSPGGTKIAFASNRDGDFEIYTMNASDGSGVTKVTNNSAEDATPSWSPDGSKLAFSSTKDGNVDIYTVGANGSGLTRLTTNRAIDATPDWSPDGSKLVFASSRDGNSELYTMNANGSGAIRLTNNHAADITPAWSANGSKIVFSTDRDGNFEIYSVAPDGTGATRLTNNRAIDTLPDA